MLDFHAHILPGIDDGSGDIETSCKMLKMLDEQKVDIVVATPHFYYDEISLENFKKQRKNAFDLLLENSTEKRPKIALGAEVRFFYGLDLYPDAEELCVEGSRFMLVEMPFDKWEPKVYKTLYNLRNKREITPVIAHAERYFYYNPKKEMMSNIVQAGALLQYNASFFYRALTSHSAFNLLKNGLVQFIGTDCHNMDDRCPNYRMAFNVLKKKRDGAFLEDLFFWENIFLNSGVTLY